MKWNEQEFTGTVMRSSLAYSRFIVLLAVSISCSDSPTATVGPPHLVFVTHPTITAAGQKISAVVVKVQDQNGTVFESDHRDITVRIDPVGSGPLTGTMTVAAVNGIATFSDLRMDVAANGYRLYATAPGALPGYSNTFNVLPGQAVKLDFSAPPVDGAVTENLKTIIVRVSDAFGNPTANVSTQITISLGNNPAGATLSGTLTATTANGTAAFTDLRIDKPGTGFTLVAQATGFSPVTSGVFNMKTPLVFTMISSGYFHSCGLTTDGKAYCWGQNSSGQLGIGTNPGAFTTPQAVAGNKIFTSISSGRDHTCGISDGAAYCWGTNFFGALGVGATSTNTPAAVTGSLSFAVTIAGYDHTCGLTMQSAGYCWGSGSSGELGDNTGQSRTTPSPIAGGMSFKTVSAGRFFSCGLTTEGAAYCWGTNGDGEIGDGQTFDRLVPSPVATQEKFSVIGAGGFHACALTLDGTAYCWGWGGNGQLGNGVSGFSRVPVLVQGPAKFTQLSVGNRHTCALTANGDAYCWGDGFNGMLGNGSTLTKFTPTLVSGGIQFKSISAGRFHTCGVSVGGVGYCWGANGNGTIGDGTTTERSVPTPVG